MASSDFVTSVKPAWKAPTNNVVPIAVAVAVADADSSWPPLSQQSPSKFGDEKKRKGIRPESQSQQLPFPPYSRRQNHHHHRPRPNPNHRFMPPPPPPPLPLPTNYVPPSCFSLPLESSLTYIYVPTLPPASSFALPTPVLYPPPSELRQKIIQQIEYYFCDDNLAKDVFFRTKMDDKGWVPVHIIVSFPQVSQLTNSCQVILDCMSYSNNVEVEEESGKLRRHDNWLKWILSPSLKASLKELNR